MQHFVFCPRLDHTQVLKIGSEKQTIDSHLCAHFGIQALLDHFNWVRAFNT